MRSSTFKTGLISVFVWKEWSPAEYLITSVIWIVCLHSGLLFSSETDVTCDVVTIMKIAVNITCFGHVS